MHRGMVQPAHAYGPFLFALEGVEEVTDRFRQHDVARLVQGVVRGALAHMAIVVAQIVQVEPPAVHGAYGLALLEDEATTGMVADLVDDIGDGPIITDAHEVSARIVHSDHEVFAQDGAAPILRAQLKFTEPTHDHYGCLCRMMW